MAFSVSGSNAKNVADTISSILLIGGGVANSTVSLFVGGVSTLQMFYKAVGVNTIFGCYEDSMSACVYWANWDKRTYVKHGNSWYLGCTSQRVYVKEVETKQVYADYSSGYKHYECAYPKKTRKSKYFTNPAQKAIYCYLNQPHVDSQMKYKIYNKTLIF